MKLLRGVILFTLAICILASSLISCEGGIKRDEAKELINGFLSKIEVGDYGGAEELMHPDKRIDIEEFISDFEIKNGVDFSDGIEILKYTNFESSYFESSVNGSRYKLNMLTKIGKSEFTVSAEAVKNKNGYGIYSFILNSVNYSSI